MEFNAATHFERGSIVGVEWGMSIRLSTFCSVIGFASAIALFTVTLTNVLSFPLRELPTGALFVCSVWLGGGFWLCARGMATVESDELRQIARFGLYIHCIALFASAAGLGA